MEDVRERAPPVVAHLMKIYREGVQGEESGAPSSAVEGGWLKGCDADEKGTGKEQHVERGTKGGKAGSSAVPLIAGSQEGSSAVHELQ